MMDELGKENMNKASGERDRAAGVTQTLDGGMGAKRQNKRRIDGGMVEALVSQASSITPLLSPFFYFCLLRNSITSSR